MRQGRLTETREAYYHVMSRVVDRQFVLNDDEKERFPPPIPPSRHGPVRVRSRTVDSFEHERTEWRHLSTKLYWESGELLDNALRIAVGVRGSV